MLFTESFITDAGKTIFARAAAQEGKIIWTDAATSSLNSDGYTTAQMNELTSQTFGTKTSSGVVTNAFAYDGQMRASIYSELTNEEYSGEARTFGAWAKIQGDQDDVLVVVARCGSGVTPTTINPASDGLVKAFVDFALDVSAEQAQSVQVSEGWYATQAALQNEIEAREALAERVVTTRKANSPTTGDNQTIYGRKTFKDKVVIDNGHNAMIEKSVDSTHGVQFGTSSVIHQTIGSHNFDYMSGGLSFTDATIDHSLWTSGHSDTESPEKYRKWFSLCSSAQLGSSSALTTLSNVDTIVTRDENSSEGYYGSVLIRASEPKDGKEAQIHLTTGQDSNTNGYSKIHMEATDFELSAFDSGNATDGSISFSATKDIDINGENHVYLVSDGYINISIKNASNTERANVYLQKLTDSQETKFVVMPTVTSGFGFDLGTSGNKWRGVYAESFYGNVTGNVTGNLTGKIPVTAYSQDPPIGSIFLAYITVSTSTSAMGIGQTAPGSIRKAQLSIDSNGVVSASYESAIALSSGTYTLLSAIDGLSANGSTIALVMRTS